MAFETTVIPVVIGALGMIKRKSEDHMKQIPGSPCLQELQKIVLNGTAHLTAACTIHVIKNTVISQSID